jgi:hypothetical protein
MSEHNSAQDCQPQFENEAPLITFQPVPVRRRHDGWTAERQEAFLKALANCGCVTHAAASVGMSKQSAHNLYNRPGAGAFRRAWEAALDCSLRLVEDGMWSRAVNGVARPIFYKGEQVGEYRHFDERLSMFLLRTRRPHRYSQAPMFVPLPPPAGWDAEWPSRDEAIADLEFHLEDLEDESSLRPDDGVNFVNFQPEEPGGEEPSCGKNPA